MKHPFQPPSYSHPVMCPNPKAADRSKKQSYASRRLWKHLRAPVSWTRDLVWKVLVFRHPSSSADWHCSLTSYCPQRTVMKLMKILGLLPQRKIILCVRQHS